MKELTRSIRSRCFADIGTASSVSVVIGTTKKKLEDY
jgi:hypothetical protein